MANVKGTDTVTMRKIIGKKSATSENTFLSTLTPEMREMYLNCLVVNMLPVDKVAYFYEKGAQFLFPEDPESLRKLGAVMAREAYSGIYKILLKIPTAEAVIERSAKIWKTYFDKGEASVENYTGKSDEVVVRGFPELPKNMLEVIAGHITTIVELTGRKNVKVTILANDPQAWRWKISWS